MRLIESDQFDYVFLSRVAERESWRKDIFRPIYHVHKWWAKRLGSVFRGVLLGCVLTEKDGLDDAFYQTHDFSGRTVLDPFMGSGTTIGEAHKLGFSAWGRDINPIAVEAVKVALGPLDRHELEMAFRQLSHEVGEQIRRLYVTTDRQGTPADVLYFFWVMQAECPICNDCLDLFSTYIIASNAYPKRKPEIQVICPECGEIFQAVNTDTVMECPNRHSFEARRGPVSGQKAICKEGHSFLVRAAIKQRRPSYRLYAKLVVAFDGTKQYLKATDVDLANYRACHERLADVEAVLPQLCLAPGHNTNQALGYGFHTWRDFFNDRQLLALGLLKKSIQEIGNHDVRNALLVLFSGVLEFNNLFTSYKGEGTGAVRHMFAHHILKPERTPIEANVWGTAKSSGSFSGLFRGRLLRACEYRERPTEVVLHGDDREPTVAKSFTGRVSPWGLSDKPRTIALSCGDSATLALPSASIDYVITDPPFFDNVHYSELADFFQAWRQGEHSSTRNVREVQDTDPARFSNKLGDVLKECTRVLKDDGLLVFSYHHSRNDGWQALAHAILEAGLAVVNAHPVKAEMSVAAPKAQAKEPIQLDMLIVCRQALKAIPAITENQAYEVASAKSRRLLDAGFRLSLNDHGVILQGQLLRALRQPVDIELLDRKVGHTISLERHQHERQEAVAMPNAN